LRSDRGRLGRRAAGAGAAGAGAAAVIRPPAAAGAAVRPRGHGTGAGTDAAAAGAGMVPEIDGITPTLAELIALRGVAHARGRARRGASGMHAQAPAMLRGRGMEYAESRGYAIGD